jgi:hypothetical protein
VRGLSMFAYLLCVYVPSSEKPLIQHGTSIVKISIARDRCLF